MINGDKRERIFEKKDLVKLEVSNLMPTND